MDVNDQRLLYKIPEVAALLGISESQVFNLIKDGDLNPVRIGRSTRLTRDELDRFVASLPTTKASA